MATIFPTIEKYEDLAKTVSSNNSKLVFWGYGNVGRILFADLLALGYCIEAIIDIRECENYDTICGIPIVSPDDFIGYERFDLVYVLCLPETEFFKVEQRLYNRGIRKVLPAFFYLFGKTLINGNTGTDALAICLSLLAKINKNMLSSEQLYAKCFDCSITDVCSLRCENCSNLMQYFKHPMHSDTASTILAIERFFKIVDYCNNVRVLGGEPFTNPEFAKYISLLAKVVPNYTWITVDTNATILPRKDDIDAMKNTNRLIVHISDYSQATQKCPEFIKLLECNGILYHYNKMVNWVSFEKIGKHNRTPAVLEDLYSDCVVKDCLAIKDTKLFLCGVSSELAKLHAVPEEINEYVDLTDYSLSDESLKRKLVSLTKRRMLLACDYCNRYGMYEQPLAIPGIQAVKPQEYYKYETKDRR